MVQICDERAVRALPVFLIVNDIEVLINSAQKFDLQYSFFILLNYKKIK